MMHYHILKEKQGSQILTTAWSEMCSSGWVGLNNFSCNAYIVRDEAIVLVNIEAVLDAKA